MTTHTHRPRRLHRWCLIAAALPLAPTLLAPPASAIADTAPPTFSRPSTPAALAGKPVRIGTAALAYRAEGAPVPTTEAITNTTPLPTSPTASGSELTINIDTTDVGSGVATIATKLYQLADADAVRVDANPATSAIDPVATNVVNTPGTPDASGYWTGTGNGYALGPALRRPGLYELEVTVTDAAGNATTGNYDFRVALPAPTNPAILTKAQQTGESCLQYGRTVDNGTTGPRVDPYFRSLRFGAWDAGATAVLALDAMRGTSSPTGAASADRLAATLRDLIAVPASGGKLYTCGDATLPAGGLAKESHEPTAAGGYTAQYELWATSLMAMARNTPGIWNQLGAHDRRAIDLIMEGSLVSNAYLLSDWTLAQVANDTRTYATIDGVTNVFNVRGGNFREGMLGQVAVAAAYFGPSTASSMLETWTRSKFIYDIDQFRTNSGRPKALSNLRDTFTYGRTSPMKPNVATDADLETALRSGKDAAGAITTAETWSFGGQHLLKPVPGTTLSRPNLSGLFHKETTDTFTQPAGCGVTIPSNFLQIVPLTGATTTYTAGRVADPREGGTTPRCDAVLAAVAGARTHVTGVMGAAWDADSTIIDLDTEDAGCKHESVCQPPNTTPAQWCNVANAGVTACKRSASTYAIMSNKSNQITHLALTTTGNLLARGTTSTTEGSQVRELMARKRIGVTDLFAKLEQGYVSYSRGRPDDVPGQPATSSPDSWVQRWSPSTTAFNDQYHHALDYAWALWTDVLKPGVPLS